jgi:hypothetical protein
VSPNRAAEIPARLNVVVLAEFGEIARNQRMAQQPETTSPPLPASPAPLPGSANGTISVSGAVIPPIPVSISAPEIRPAAGSQAAQPGQKQNPQRIPRWLERAELFLRVVLRMYIGVAVCYAPWSRLFWDQNPLFVQYPTLAIYAANGAVRGIISGLGLLNLWIAFHDAFRQRDGK